MILIKTVLALAVVVTLTALLVVAGSDGGAIWMGLPVFAICGIAALSIQWAAFVPAYKYQTEVFYDLVGSVTYLVLVTLALMLSGQATSRDLILAVLIGIWSVRLGSFLFNRIIHAGKDSRFDSIKPSVAKFFLAWTIQGMWVIVTAGAGLAAITSNIYVEIDVWAIAGVMLWGSGFIIEVVADGQKQSFRSNSANRDKFICSGLWAYSRHPNYFGEIILWTGVALIAFPVLSGWQLATLISPLFVLVLLTSVSGIPLLEEKADQKWGDDPTYQRYKQQVPVLLPTFKPFKKSAG